MKKLLITILLLSVVSLCNASQIGSIGNKIDAEIASNGRIDLVYERSGCLYYRFYDGQWSNELQIPGSCETYNTRFNPKISNSSQGTFIFWVNKNMTQILYTRYGQAGFDGILPVFSDSVGGPDTNRFDVAHNDDRVWVVAQTDMALKSRYFDGLWSSPDTILYDPSEPKYPMLGNDLLLTFSYQGKLWKSQYNQSWDVPELIQAECCVNTGSVYNDKIAWINWKAARPNTTPGNYYATIRGDLGPATLPGPEFSDLMYMEIGKPAKILISSPEFFDCPYSSECPIPQVVETANGTVCVIFATGGDNSFIDMFIKENGAWSRESIAGTYANNPAAVVSGNDVHIIYSGPGWQLQHEILHFGDSPTPTPTIMQPSPTSTATEIVKTPTASPTQSPTQGATPCPTCAPCPTIPLPDQCGKVGCVFVTILMLSVVLTGFSINKK